MLPTLTTLIQYSNARVIQRYTESFPQNKLTGEEAFPELMKYLWISQKHKEDLAENPQNQELQFVCGIYEEISEIDDMWHSFLLFTKDYSLFCNQYFAEYIHHNPADDSKKLDKEIFEIEFRRYLSYIYDHLGEETLKKWFG